MDPCLLAGCLLVFASALQPFAWVVRRRLRARKVQALSMNEAVIHGQLVYRLAGRPNQWAVSGEPFRWLSELDAEAVEQAVIDRELRRPLHERGGVSLAPDGGGALSDAEAP